MRRSIYSAFASSDSVLTFIRQIVKVCIILYSICIPSAAAKVHTVPWTTDSSSLHPSSNDTILYVNEDDKIKFECQSPSYRMALFWSSKREDFDSCSGDLLSSCNESMTFELQVTEFQWLPGMPAFPKGKPVYFFGRNFECRYLGMRLVTIYSTKPVPKTDAVPKKTTLSDWGHPKTTVKLAKPPTKTEYFWLTQRPKTSAKIYPAKPATTKLPKPTVKKSVPMLKTSRAGYASMGQCQAQHSLIILLAAVVSLMHFIIIQR